MRWIKTGLQIGQAVKNVQRLRHIVAVFARHGFADVVDRTNLGKYLPKRFAAYAETISEQNTAERLRHAFEELGPAFVKLGQLLSTRPDLIPDSFVEEFTKLQDNVQPLPFDVIKAVIEREVKMPIDQAFQSVNPTPLAAASISQVHDAVLKSGEQVVLKVQRPEIEKLIDQDIALLAFIARLLERYVPETRMASPVTVVDEFFRTLTFELDFYIEANNMAKISENMKCMPEIVVPKIYRELSTSKLLVQEKLEGIRVNDIAAMERAGIDRKQVVRTGARAFFRSIMIDGLFHGDLHGGNMFVLPGNRLGIIDFGIVGRLSQRSRDQLANLVMALLTEDFENLCYQYAELGQASPSLDFEAFQREVRNTLSPYMGLTMAEVNSGRVLIEATKIAAKFEIKVPGDWMIVFKALLTTEGMGRTLDPEFDMLEMGQDLAKELIKTQYSFQRMSKDLVWVGKDLLSLFQMLPRQIRWMFRKFNSNDFAFEIKIPELTAISKQLEANSKRTALGTIAAGLFIAGSIALNAQSEAMLWGHPLPATILYILGLVLLIRTLWR